jgi:small subunit ribosomal protein S5
MPEEKTTEKTEEIKTPEEAPAVTQEEVIEEAAENETPPEEAEKKIEEVRRSPERGGQRGGQRGDRRRFIPEKKEWIPKTDLGRRVVKGEFSNLGEILGEGTVILEPEIVDYFIPEIEQEVIYIGGSPGKGGGIRRTATKRTARMHKSGRRFKLTALVVVGDGENIVGIGTASGREHRVAIEKATEKAKLNVIRVRKGCGSWECGCGGGHSLPFKVESKFGSVKVVVRPAPKGVGIVASEASKKVLKLAGLKDTWVRTFGHTQTRSNLVNGLFEALKNLNRTKGDL